MSETQFVYHCEPMDDNLNSIRFRDKWVENHNPEMILTMDHLFITDTFLSTIHKIVGEEIDNPKITISNTVLVEDSTKDILLMITLTHDNPFGIVKRNVSVTAFGSNHLVETLMRKLESFKNFPTLSWWFKSDECVSSREFSLDKPLKFYPEFYPWISDVDAYLTEFNESNSNILLLLGDPGTGKTSFIKYIMHKFNKSAMTTYDEGIMKTDQIYIDFISSNEYDYLMLEDSDILLGSRSHDNNKSMSKILNAADGLIPLINKKFVFTANIKDSSNIDEAFLRPGRCFDVLNFRPLTKSEAVIAAKASGQILDTDIAKDEYTIAEIFNGNQKKYFKSRFSM